MAGILKKNGCYINIVAIRTLAIPCFLQLKRACTLLMFRWYVTTATFQNALVPLSRNTIHNPILIPNSITQRDKQHHLQFHLQVLPTPSVFHCSSVFVGWRHVFWHVILPLGCQRLLTRDHVLEIGQHLWISGVLPCVIIFLLWP